MFQNIFQSPDATTHTLEILIMWLVSGLIGLLIGYIIWHLRPREYLGLKKQIGEHTTRIRELEAANGRLNIANEKLAAELAEWKAKYEALLAEFTSIEGRLAQREEALAAIASAADDLTDLDGIDATIEGLLQQAGIHTFQNLANTKLETLRAMLKAAGPAYRSADPDGWRKQAYLAYRRRKEHYAGFAELKIGRKQIDRLYLQSRNMMDIEL
ncbi:MAG: hypothetical protein KDD09_23645 [Phaeodactylibacter sp.]|nr:hypothetical protein [Phaeodactylibacter sp.]MCB0615371.1 hypothetical protein [Phaeodactylibacter sp.]MCB9304728.1 hypothetical protein [Lewinellaceae bacterium]